MQIIRACHLILDQLTEAVSQLKAEDFVKPSKALSQSTVGQHLRHTLEFFLCLESGYQAGVVNYDKRNHDKLIESDKFIALNSIQQIRSFINSVTTDLKLNLEVGYDRTNEECVTIETSYSRELIYNIEHAVHHMAIMKIGINELAPYVTLPSDFGVAVSTIRHKASVALEHKH